VAAKKGRVGVAAKKGRVGVAAKKGRVGKFKFPTLTRGRGMRLPSRLRSRQQRLEARLRRRQLRLEARAERKSIRRAMKDSGAPMDPMLDAQLPESMVDHAMGPSSGEYMRSMESGLIPSAPPMSETETGPMTDYDDDEGFPWGKIALGLGIVVALGVVVKVATKKKNKKKKKKKPPKAPTRPPLRPAL